MTAKRLGSSTAIQRAPRSGGPVTRSAGADASTLATYLQETHAYNVLDAKQEIAIAQTIEERELAHWRVLVSHAPTLELVVTAISSHFDSPKELLAMRKLAHSKRRTSANWKAAGERAATALRELDTARVALLEADNAVRAYLQEKGGAASFLSKLNEARRGQQDAKNKFMTANLRLVVSLARRYETGLMPLADLIQEGNLGLMRAVERFDHRRGFRFSTYATWWIRHGFNRASRTRDAWCGCRYICWMTRSGWRAPLRS